MAQSHVMSIGLLISFWALCPACDHSNWIIPKHEQIFLPDISRILVAITIIFINLQLGIKLKFSVYKSLPTEDPSLRHLEREVSE